MARGRGGGGHGRSHGHRGGGIGHRGIGHGGFGHRGIGHHHHGIGFGSHRFGRSHCYGSHNSFRNHYHHHIGGRGGIVLGGFSLMFDTVASNPMPPTLLNGTYSFAGNQMSAMTNMENFPSFYM